MVDINKSPSIQNLSEEEKRESRQGSTMWKILTKNFITNIIINNNQEE